VGGCGAVVGRRACLVPPGVIVVVVVLSRGGGPICTSSAGHTSARKGSPQSMLVEGVLAAWAAAAVMTPETLRRGASKAVLQHATRQTQGCCWDNWCPKGFRVVRRLPL
jgi:hypothetical protein